MIQIDLNSDNKAYIPIGVNKPTSTYTIVFNERSTNQTFYWYGVEDEGLLPGYITIDLTRYNYPNLFGEFEYNLINSNGYKIGSGIVNINGYSNTVKNVVYDPIQQFKSYDGTK